jgi:hypothetical protein
MLLHSPTAHAHALTHTQTQWSPFTLCALCTLQQSSPKLLCKLHISLLRECDSLQLRAHHAKARSTRPHTYTSDAPTKNTHTDDTQPLSTADCRRCRANVTRPARPRRLAPPPPRRPPRRPRWAPGCRRTALPPRCHLAAPAAPTPPASTPAASPGPCAMGGRQRAVPRAPPALAMARHMHGVRELSL